MTTDCSAPAAGAAPDLSTLRGKVFIDAKEPPLRATLPPWLVRELNLGCHGGETPDLSTLRGRAFVDAKEPPIGARFSAVALAALGLRHRVSASEGK